MDDAATPTEDEATRVARATVDAEDVLAVFNLLLRRDPEPEAVEGRCGKPLDELFYDALNSGEFSDNVLLAIGAHGRLPRYHGRRSFDHLRGWVKRRAPLSPELISRLVASLSWREFYRTLLGDEEVMRRASALAASGIDKFIRQSHLDDDVDFAREDIEGECDYISVWEVKGWCLNLFSDTDRLTVDILVDDKIIGSADCNEYRRDVQGRLGGDGACGFTFMLPPVVREALREERWITVREHATGAPIGGPVALRRHGPNRVDALDELEGELGRTRTTLARLEVELARASASLGYHLGAYDEYARARIAPSDEYLAARLEEAFHGAQPLVSVVLAVNGREPQAVSHTLRSLSDQVYPNCEVIVVGLPKARGKDPKTAYPKARVHPENGPPDAGVLTRAALETCGGDWVIFVSPGDRLERDALLEMVIAMRGRHAAAVYADEDVYEVSDPGDYREPRLKPGFDPDYLLSENYIGRLVLFDRAAMSAVGGFKHDPDKGGFLDLLLRLVEAEGPDSIVHCPRVLFHTSSAARSEDAAMIGEVARTAVSEHFARTGSGAVAELHDDPQGGARAGALRIRWPLPARSPGVSIIIPTKDHPELLGPCLLSLSVSMSDYAGDVEVVVVDNGTADPIALALMATLADAGAIRLARYPGPFNWSALNNRAAAEAAGEVLLFLNNDIVTLGVGWLRELVSQALRPEVGAVGARLLFGDRSIQHAGVVVGVAGATRHESVGTAVSDDGYLGRAKLQRRTSALTGACLATRRDVFEQLGGFDEAAFKIYFNDTDYCMKARAAGLALVYSPVATLLHFESASLSEVASPTDGTVEELAVFRERWREALRNDPYYNPHFDRAARPFAYLAAPRRPR